MYASSTRLLLLLVFSNLLFGNAFHTLPPVDVYNGRNLTRKHLSKEHIIPKRHFLSKKDADDLLNLAPCDLHVNRMRSDYKLGYASPEMVDDVHCVRIYSQTQNFSGHLNRRTRTFYPSDDADVGILGRSIIELLGKYPYLYQNLPDIVDHPSTLSKWSRVYPSSPFEEARNRKMII
jgi:endonuclease I